MATKLDALNKRVLDLTRQRNDTLRELREQCKHLSLAELDDSPPKRICVDCGAEEDGWDCGYQVLAMADEKRNVPHSRTRRLVLRTSDRLRFYGYRKVGSSYFVGQSHSNFGVRGIPSYKKLTEITE